MNRHILLIGVIGLTFLAGCALQATQVPAEPHVDLQTVPILRVAYPKPDGPWVWTEGEGASRLAESINSMDVCISDDGRQVAYLGGTNWELFSVSVDEGDPKMLLDRAYLDRLTPPGGGFVTIDEFDFGARSHALYFNTRIPGEQQYDLYRVDSSGGVPVRILAPGEGGNFSFSPDGQWMTVYHPYEIILARPDGTDAHLAFTFPEGTPIGSLGPQIVWAQDSSGFSVISRESESEEPQRMIVWFIPVEGDPVERMRFHGYPGMHLSPDGSKVVYFHVHDGATDIHFVDSQGTDTLYTSTGEDAFFMDWSPDSRHFIINYVQYGSTPAEWINVPYVCALGEAPVRLTDTPTAYPAYWVDDQRVLFHGEGLRLLKLGQASSLIDEGLLVNDFDFTLIATE
jgi:hypothetical protein